MSGENFPKNTLTTAEVDALEAHYPNREKNADIHALISAVREARADRKRYFDALVSCYPLVLSNGNAPAMDPGRPEHMASVINEDRATSRARVAESARGSLDLSARHESLLAALGHSESEVARLERERDEADAERNTSNALLALVEEVLMSSECMSSREPCVKASDHACLHCRISYAMTTKDGRTVLADAVRAESARMETNAAESREALRTETAKLRAVRDAAKELREALLVRKELIECRDCKEFIGDGFDHAMTCKHYTTEALAAAERKRE